MKAIKIPVTGPLELVEVEQDYRTIARAIGNGCQLIEGVRSAKAASSGHTMYADEEGLMHDPVPNPRATWLSDVDMIVGDAVLVAESGPEFDIVDMPKADYWLAVYAKVFELLVA